MNVLEDWQNAIIQSGNEVVALLTKLDATLGSLYQTALDYLSTTPTSKADLVVGFHCVREVLNRLPFYLGARNNAFAKEEVDQAVQVLASMYADSLVTPGKDILELDPEAPLVTIQRDIYEQLRKVALATNQGTLNGRVKSNFIVTGRVTRTTVSPLQEFYKAFRFFTGGAHLRTSEIDDSIQDEVFKHLKIVHGILLTRLRNFYETNDEILAFLSQANLQSLVEGELSWLDPQSELLQELLFKLGSIHHRRILFAGLKNPKWLSVFLEGKLVSVPVDGSKTLDEEGDIFPEGIYLIEVAKYDPEAVVTFLRPALDVRNFGLQRTIIEVAKTIPIKFISSWSEGLGNFWNANQSYFHRYSDLQIIIERYTSAGFPAQSLSLLESLFGIIEIEASTNNLGRPEYKTSMDKYIYSSILNSALPLFFALAQRGLERLCIWLERVTELEFGPDHETNYEFSLLYRPQIEVEPEHAYSREILHALVDAVIAFGITSLNDLESSEKYYEVISKSRGIFGTRIEMYFLSSILKSDLPVKERYFPVIFDAMCNLGGMARLRSPEYRELIELAMDHLPPEMLSSWYQLMATEAPFTDEATRIYENEKHWGVENATLESAFRLLRVQALVGTPVDRLPSELQYLTEDIRALTTEVQRPTISFSMGTGIVDSQLRDEILASTPANFLGIVNHALAVQNDKWPMRNESVRLTLAEIIKEEPSFLIPRLETYRELDKDLYSALINAYLTEAVKLNASELLALTEFVHDLGESSYAGSEIPENRRNFSLYVARFLEVLSRMKILGQDDKLLSLFWVIADLLLTNEGERSDEGEAYGDALTRSMNQTRQCTFRALLSPFVRKSSISTSSERSSVELSIDLTIHDAFHLSENLSSSTAALMGEQFAVLVNWKPDLASTIALECYTALTSTSVTLRKIADIFLSVFLSRNQSSLNVLHTLRSSIDLVLTESYGERQHDIGWKSSRGIQETLGTWLLHLYLASQIELDHLWLQSLFSLRHPLVASESLDQFAWSLNEISMNTLQVERAQNLFDWIYGEVQSSNLPKDCLFGLKWICGNTHFRPEWWLPLLEEAVKNDGFDEHGFLLDTLMETARVLPAESLGVIEHYWKRPDPDMVTHHLIYADIPVVLALVYQESALPATKIADRLLDLIARSGYTEIRELVEKAKEESHTGNL